MKEVMFVLIVIIFVLSTYCVSVSSDIITWVNKQITISGVSPIQREKTEAQ